MEKERESEGERRHSRERVVAHVPFFPTIMRRSLLPRVTYDSCLNFCQSSILNVDFELNPESPESPKSRIESRVRRENLFPPLVLLPSTRLPRCFRFRFLLRSRECARARAHLPASYARVVTVDYCVFALRRSRWDTRSQRCQRK